MEKKVNYMENIFRRDFIQADDFGIALEIGQRNLNDVSILRGLVERVRDDIDILDQEIKKELDSKNEELNKINKSKKNAIDTFGKDYVEDDFDLNEDFERYKKELAIIKKIGYERGWLE
jgi:hypothetical protein